MRIRAAALPAVVAIVLALGACSADGSDSATASATATAPAIEVGEDGPFPEVSGDIGDKPELTFPGEDPAAGLQRRVLSEGDGAEVQSGDLIVVDYLGQVWDGDAFDNSWDRGTPAAFQIGVGNVIQGWDAGLIGQRTGSRVLLTIPPDLGYQEAGNPDAGIGGTDTIVFVVDILGRYAADVSGDPDAEVTDEAADTPVEITGELGQPVSIKVVDGAEAPTEVRTTVLARADGEPVVAGALVLQYAAALWDNSTALSTWEYGSAQAITIGGGSEFDSIIGLPVGSRVLIEIPATGEDAVAVAIVVDIIDQF